MFKFVEPWGGAHITGQRPSDLVVATSYDRYLRHLRCNDMSLPVSICAFWRMIALEVFKEH